MIYYTDSCKRRPLILRGEDLKAVLDDGDVRIELKTFLIHFYSIGCIGQGFVILTEAEISHGRFPIFFEGFFKTLDRFVVLADLVVDFRVVDPFPG